MSASCAPPRVGSVKPPARSASTPGTREGSKGHGVVGKRGRPASPHSFSWGPVKGLSCPRQWAARRAPFLLSGLSTSSEAGKACVCAVLCGGMNSSGGGHAPRYPRTHVLTSMSSRQNNTYFERATQKPEPILEIRSRCIFDIGYKKNHTLVISRAL